MVASISKPMPAAALETYHSKDNYYSQSDGLENSQWRGQYSQQQQLSDIITAAQWQNACHGQDPQGNPLRRHQRNSRAGWDITLSASKSASLKALVDQDPRVLQAHRQAVIATVNYIEQHCIFAQVKHKGQLTREQTKAGQFALFEHDDNRNQDPQLHTHIVILNQTPCADGKSRTLDSRELFFQKKTIGAYYDHTFAHLLHQQRFEITWTDDHTFEIQGYTQAQLDNFSSRRQDIREYLAQKNIALEQASDAQKTIACLESRSAKVHKLTPEDHTLQRQTWAQACTDLGIVHPQPDLEKTYDQRPYPGNLSTVIHDALETATAHQVAVSRPQLLRYCLRHAQEVYSPAVIEDALDRHPDLIPTQDGRWTTQQVLNREQLILDFARQGQGTQQMLATPGQVKTIAQAKGLNASQTAGLCHLTTSTDQIILLQGNAGVGKTYTLQAFKQCLGHNPHLQIRGLAPSAAAAEVLGAEAEIAASTVDRYLLTPNERLKQNEILLIDEAGMLSTQQMAALIQKANVLNTRLILVGDTKQLSAIEAGAPFRLLQERSPLPMVTLDHNLRQVTPQLKQAVELAAQQQPQEALDLLDQHDCIREIKLSKARNRHVARLYLERPHERQLQTLILCDTNADRREITRQIRGAYIENQTLGAAAQMIQILHPRNLDSPALSQAHHYQPGDVIRFCRSTRKFPEPYYRVTQVEAHQLTLTDRFGNTVDLPLERYQQREVFACQELELRVGDRLRFTRNHREWQQINGQLFTIDGFNADGTISINTRGKTVTVSVDQLLHTDYAYCRTVYAAQGWTAQEAIWAPGEQPGREQTYVALSRAKSELQIVTLDRLRLGLRVQRSQAQENAQDLVVEPDAQGVGPQIGWSDAELVAQWQAVREWQRWSHPQRPDPLVGEGLQAQVEGLSLQQEALAGDCQAQQQKLERLGVRPEVEVARRQLLQERQRQLVQVERQLGEVQEQLQDWQKEVQVYREWEEDPQTQLMRQRVSQLQAPEVQARWRWLQQGYGLVAAAERVLVAGGGSEVEGQGYRIEVRGQGLRVWRGEEELLRAIDRRRQGGMLEIQQMNASPEEQQRVLDWAEAIGQRQQPIPRRGLKL